MEIPDLIFEVKGFLCLGKGGVVGVGKAQEILSVNVVFWIGIRIGGEESREVGEKGGVVSD